MIIAVGTDLVDIGRLADRLRRAPRLASRLLTPGELVACSDRAESVAARLAAKEAVLKALGAALGPAIDADRPADAGARPAADCAPTQGMEADQGRDSAVGKPAPAKASCPDHGGDSAVGPRASTGPGAAAPPRWRYWDIEVLGGRGAAPRLALHGGAAETAAALGIARWHLSLAHDGGAALAFVVAEG